MDMRKLLIGLILLSKFCLAQNQNTTIQVSNKNYEFDSAHLIIDSSIFTFKLGLNDTLRFDAFNLDTVEIKILKIKFYKNGKVYERELKSDYNNCLELKIETEEVELKWYKRLRFRKQLPHEYVTVRYCGCWNSCGFVWYE